MTPETLYRRLLRVTMPPGFPPDAEDGLAELFRDLHAAARRRGAWARLAFWPRMLLDLAWTAAAERRRARRESATGWTGGSHRRDGRMSGVARRVRTTVAQAVRSVVRRPGHALVMSVTIGLGVGVGTVVAVLARDVLLRPLPYESPSELLRLRERSDDGRTWWPSRANFEDWRRVGAPGIRGVEAAAVPESAPVLIGGRAVRADVAEASAGLFDLLGARVTYGRAPRPGEWNPGGAPVAVVSRAFWRGPLGGAPLDGVELGLGLERFPVVGVLEDGFGFLAEGGGWGDADVWVPLERRPNEESRQSHGIHVVARVEDGITRERADDALDAMAARVAAAAGEPTNGHSVLTTSLEEDLLGPARRPLRFLVWAAAGVLLVAALNLAGTLLVDGMGRERELTVRRALGAGRRQLVGQLTAESLLAAVPGALLAWVVAWIGIETARRLDPGALPRLDAVALDPGVFVLAVALAAALALASSGVPALLLSGSAATARVAAVARSGPGRRLRRVWNGMIVVQVALTFVLLVGSSALLAGMRDTLGSDLGFEPAGVTAIHISLPELRYGDGPTRIAWWDQALEALRGVPGAAAVSLTNVLPHETQARISGTTNPDVESDTWMWTAYRTVDPEYFDVLGIPVLQGAFPDRGEAGAAMVDLPVIDRLLASGPAGERAGIGDRVRSGLSGRPVTVTGVVGPVREWSVEPGRIGTMYVDFHSEPDGLPEGYLLVRGRNGRPVEAAGIRQGLGRIDPGLTLSVEPLPALMRRTLGSRRLVLALAGAFAMVGLVFAVVGIYGVVAYVARRRVREAGVRMALGASAAGVRRRALWEGVVPAATGLAAGAMLTLMLYYGLGPDPGEAAWLPGTLPGGEALGVAPVAGAALLLVACAALAAWLPARAASRVDLVTLLREE